MANRISKKRDICGGFWARAVAFVLGAQMTLWALLMALILSGTVPQGFMRTAGEEGMMLVLCTPEGPTEVWLSASGDISEDAPAEHAPTEVSDCLAVTLSLVLVQAWFETLGQPAQFSPYRIPYVDQRTARVAVHTPLQPRAPPALI